MDLWFFGQGYHDHFGQGSKYHWQRIHHKI